MFELRSIQAMLRGGSLTSFLLCLLALSWSLVARILWLDSLLMLALAHALGLPFWMASLRFSLVATIIRTSKGISVVLPILLTFLS